MWGGNRTWAGAQTQQILVSVLRTCWQQDKDPFPRLISLLCSNILSMKTGGKSPSPQDVSQLNSLGWALIVLLSDPPSDSALAPDLLTEMLKREALTFQPEIVKLFRNLEKQAKQ